MSWASSTARLQSEVERALGDEASGPVAQLIPYPRNPDVTDDEDGNDDRLLADIRAGRGGLCWSRRWRLVRAKVEEAHHKRTGCRIG